jgi:hypothetical protein
MANRTDQSPEQPSPAPLRDKLLEMADRLDQDPDHSADAPFTPAERIALVKDISGTDAGALLDITPRFATPTTRGTYAARLRKIAGVR